MTIYSGNTKLLCPPCPRGAAGLTVRLKQRCASVHHHSPGAEPPASPAAPAKAEHLLPFDSIMAQEHQAKQ